MINTRNAWIAIETQSSTDSTALPGCILELGGSPNLYLSMAEDDWILIVKPNGDFIRTGRVLRIRTGADITTAYFDRILTVDKPVTIETAGLSMPKTGSVSRLQWNVFAEALPKLAGKTVEDVPLIDDQVYIRELLQLAVMDDLLGPANGPHEQVVDMSVRDRYLVGKLAPMESGGGGIEGLEGPLATEADEGDPGDLDVHKGRHDPGAEFDGATGRVDAEAESLDEIDAASNQSLVPSSFGITFCVDGDVDTIEVEARWGRYRRNYETEIFKTKRNPESGEEEQGAKAKVWQRIPCGGTVTIDLCEGAIPNRAPDSDQPEVRVQGTIRGEYLNGGRLVTLFLVNAQEEPDENKDSAWLFQPQLIVRAAAGTANKEVFRRRLAAREDSGDTERDTLEMIYRRHVEFAVGHGVAVHAETAPGETERAIEVRTVVMPQCEAPVTQPPGSHPQDRPAMRVMVERGYLDMRELAEMDRQQLTKALTILTDDYKNWIAEQRDRIGSIVVGYDQQAHAALDSCAEIQVRLVEGVRVLSSEDNDLALKAFRFANAVMAQQRIHTLFALTRRRGEQVVVSDFDERKNRSWRPFQLAFILLSLPSLADPTHADRTKPVEAIADLLWFPTGGGKTEAYLGVAAFAMAIRRMQGETGGYDGSRGLTVIMRYTLRLLTLQQFQRATTLICAMEIARQEALAAGDESLGSEPFTIGLWVGNKVTPGTTADSHTAIQRTRDPDKFDAGGASPGQLTNCPWCGSVVSDRRNIEIDKHTLRTKIYCGDKKGRCAFSKGKSTKKPHPGLPVLVVDEEIYHRPPTMMIATVDKFAMMAWRGESRSLFGLASTECPRHGLLWPGTSCCTGNHRAGGNLPSTKVRKIRPIRPPDLVIQDEFHLISGPLGTMVGLYETAVDELCTWTIGDKRVKPKIVASTATVPEGQRASQQRLHAARLYLPG